MDVLSDLLFRARASDAQVRQLIHPAPWSMTYTDAPPLTLVATLGGPATVRLADNGSPPAHLDTGDVALISKTARYTIADHPDTPEQYIIHKGRKYLAGEGEVPADHASLAARTYGADSSDAAVMLRGAYHLTGDVAARLLDMLPALAVVPAEPRTEPVLELLTREARLDEPGQDAVLRRLLDLLLVLALRAWCARAETGLPAWCRALTDPAIGDALQLLHQHPAHPWTVADLATEIGMSRAAFAARFTRLVGEPPLAYLTNWRMTIAADQLRDTTATIAAVAKNVGYQDPFAFSVAFKRTYDYPPSSWRRTHRDHST
ncbi:AraC family transcriptional regulator [Nocardia terpenica]|uniref:cupin domain-containing protein n=1 Tax=Nocardia terpenica TaxID=455432 RepID=UPI001894096E|nr:AraC family transcriptional regulator [Nocardia terpenica]MBF6064422.1 AraC family transcriptional regulator [Nocardia terpenica]MBF6106954.1 AraC family transcriptional regulator [Nocardia terpenica]MBF6114390.1 AraC family transcriptional regulator [Nocardia terpenica]MBF6121524.1 AraC family transcriptional regulator [Nocardia terpenica]MBF6153939.1 AraC family transcriptional regulator [Nocardia terpenica]